MGSRTMMAERTTATCSHATVGASVPRRTADGMSQVEEEVWREEGGQDGRGGPQQAQRRLAMRLRS